MSKNSKSNVKDNSIEKVIKEVRDRFGKCLKVTEPKSEYVRTHLRELSLVPDSLVKTLVSRGLKVRIGHKYMTEFSSNKYYMYTTPRGHENKKWSEIAGCYDPVSKIVYAGAGSDPDGSLILHELGHGVADLFDLNNSPELVNTHIRLFDKLEDYYQQGGPGGVAGCEELFAEAFSLYLIASEEGFLLRYKDMNFYNFFAKKFPKT